MLGHMRIMLGSYVNVELSNPLTKRTLLDARQLLDRYPIYRDLRKSNF